MPLVTRMPAAPDASVVAAEKDQREIHAQRCRLRVDAADGRIAEGLHEQLVAGTTIAICAQCFQDGVFHRGIGLFGLRIDADNPPGRGALPFGEVDHFLEGRNAQEAIGRGEARIAG
ncbi:MAG TPA: hypothetical protein VF638_09400, partial [Sphingomonas sp.]